jgi:hypothetical protein
VLISHCDFIPYLIHKHMSTPVLPLASKPDPVKPEKKSNYILYRYTPIGENSFYTTSRMLAVKVGDEWKDFVLKQSVQVLERETWELIENDPIGMALIESGELTKICDDRHLIATCKEKEDIPRIIEIIKSTFVTRILEAWLTWVRDQNQDKYTVFGKEITKQLKALKAGKLTLPSFKDDWSLVNVVPDLEEFEWDD